MFFNYSVPVNKNSAFIQSTKYGPGDKSSLLHFIPAESSFCSSFSVSMPPPSDVQRANQLPNLVKRTIKNLNTLQKWSYIYKQLSLNLLRGAKDLSDEDH